LTICLQLLAQITAENPVFENELDNRPTNEIIVIHFAYKSLGFGLIITPERDSGLGKLLIAVWTVEVNVKK
jgi:hypothetical protein